MVLHGFVSFCMVLYGFVWFCMVLYGFAWFCMVLYGFAWFCMVLEISLLHFLFCFLDRAFSIMKTKNKPKNAQINSGLIYY